MLSSKDYCGALVVMSVVCVRLVCVLCVMFCACIRENRNCCRVRRGN